jgi:phosphonate transport system substrate-binding protein
MFRGRLTGEVKMKRHRISFVFWIVALCATLISGATRGAQAPETIKIKTLSLGLISTTSQKEIEAHFRDFARYVARKLSADIEGKVIVVPSALQLAKLLEEKQVDFYMESPYPTYIVNKQGSAVVILRRWKSGMAEYRSLIFTKSDSGVARLEDLKGKMIAFEDPGSTSGYFLPKVFLLNKGFSLKEKPGIEAKIAPSEIGYLFASTAAKIADLVLSKRLAAGAFSNDDYGRMDGKRRANLTILAQTETFPRHLVSARKGLPPPVEKRLKEILLTMHEDNEGRKILEQTNTTKFDPLPGGEEGVRRKLIELFRPR